MWVLVSVLYVQYLCLCLYKHVTMYNMHLVCLWLLECDGVWLSQLTIPQHPLKSIPNKNQRRLEKQNPGKHL